MNEQTGGAGAVARVECDEVRRIKPGSGESFKDIDIGPEMVVIPAGEFVMGSPKDEPRRGGEEGPQHKVTIPHPLAVSRFTITFDEWDAAQLDADWQRFTGRDLYRPEDRGWGRDGMPAINVNWEDAQAYVKWLREKTGKGYRLLSEAEWEYICRAGTTTPFWWGHEITYDHANYDANYIYEGGGTRGAFRLKTVPVKSFEPNPWGLYQVHGNVWEWCEDYFHDNYVGAPTDGSARKSGDTNYRVFRGGSCVNPPGLVRAGSRGRHLPTLRIMGVGIRVCRTLEL